MDKTIKTLKVTGVILIFLFLGLYYTKGSGYYEFEQHKKMTLTEEKIRQFEQDVKEGIPIDSSKYLENDTTNYQNKISKISLKFSETIEKTFKKGMESLFRFISKTIEE